MSVPTIDTFGCARFHPFGNEKPQKRAGPATRERRKPWRRQAPPFPESVIHRELASCARAVSITPLSFAPKTEGAGRIAPLLAEMSRMASKTSGRTGVVALWSR